MTPDRVEIVAYQPTWPAEFAAIAAPLRQALGEQAMRIDHIGSTSVPGLAAKDIIDVQVSVVNFSEQLITALNAIGYTIKAHIMADHRPPNVHGPDSEWEKRFFQPPAGQRPTNLHVRILGRANQRYALLFRDYLRTHRSAADAYAEVKHRLALYAFSRIAYVETKDPICDIIMSAAEEWAEATQWQVGPSDA